MNQVHGCRTILSVRQLLHDSPARPRIHVASSSSTQATAFGEIRRCRGKSPRRSSRQIVERDSPVRARTSGKRRSFAGRVLVACSTLCAALTGGGAALASCDARAGSRSCEFLVSADALCIFLPPITLRAHQSKCRSCRSLETAHRPSTRHALCHTARFEPVLARLAHLDAVRDGARN